MTDPRPNPYEPTPYAAPGPQAKTNTLAIISLILGFLVAPAGIVTGHIALNQIKKSGEAGRGLALAGTILGYAITIGSILYWVGIVFFLIIFGASGGFDPSNYPTNYPTDFPYDY